VSSHSENSPEMTCADFEASFDQYVDDLLEPRMAEACCCHLAKCTPCDREVTRWQQTRILLSTAVTDFATAVDVSSVRNDVFAALGLDGRDSAAVVERRRSAMREAAHERAGDARRDSGRRARREAGAPRRSGFAAVLRFASAATVSAMTAAAAVLLLTPAPTTAPSVVASAPAPTSVASVSRSSMRPVAWSKNSFEDVAPAVNTPPPLARPEVSHVDGLEAAPGQLVSTWVQPRTNARVIWVQDRGLGAPVRMAGLGK